MINNKRFTVDKNVQQNCNMYHFPQSLKALVFTLQRIFFISKKKICNSNVETQKSFYVYLGLVHHIWFRRQLISKKVTEKINLGKSCTTEKKA